MKKRAKPVDVSKVRTFSDCKSGSFELRYVTTWRVGVYFNDIGKDYRLPHVCYGRISDKRRDPVKNNFIVTYEFYDGLLRSDSNRASKFREKMLKRIGKER